MSVPVISAIFARILHVRTSARPHFTVGLAGKLSAKLCPPRQYAFVGVVQVVTVFGTIYHTPERDKQF